MLGTSLALSGGALEFVADGVHQHKAHEYELYVPSPYLEQTTAILQPVGNVTVHALASAALEARVM